MTNRYSCGQCGHEFENVNDGDNQAPLCDWCGSTTKPTDNAGQDWLKTTLLRVEDDIE